MAKAKEKEQKKELVMREKEHIEKSQGEPTREGVYFSPAVDIYETADAIVLLADVPGADVDGLDVHVEDSQLTITAQVAQREGGDQAVYTEYGVGGYSRSFRLGDSIDESKIEARLRNGVLELTLPKADRHRPRKVAVTAA